MPTSADPFDGGDTLMAGAQGFGLSVDEAAEDAMRGQALSAILRGQSRITRGLGLAPSECTRAPRPVLRPV